MSYEGIILCKHSLGHSPVISATSDRTFYHFDKIVLVILATENAAVDRLSQIFCFRVKISVLQRLATGFSLAGCSSISKHERLFVSSSMCDSLYVLTHTADAKRLYYYEQYF